MSNHWELPSAANNPLPLTVGELHPRMLIHAFLHGGHQVTLELGSAIAENGPWSAVVREVHLLTAGWVNRQLNIDDSVAIELKYMVRISD